MVVTRIFLNFYSNLEVLNILYKFAKYGKNVTYK